MKIRLAILVLSLACFAPYETVAACVLPPGKIVNVFVLRCESAAPYLELASAAKPYRNIVGVGNDGVILGPPVDLARISEGKFPGTVLVVQIQSEFRLQRVSKGRAIKVVGLDDEWTAVSEHARFWWHGPPGGCKPSERDETSELWIHRPCCDTLPSFGPCLADMDFAEPVPDDLRNRRSENQKP